MASGRVSNTHHSTSRAPTIPRVPRDVLRSPVKRTSPEPSQRVKKHTSSTARDATSSNSRKIGRASYEEDSQPSEADSWPVDNIAPYPPKSHKTQRARYGEERYRSPMPWEANPFPPNNIAPYPSDSRGTDHIRHEQERYKSSTTKEIEPWAVNVNRIAPYPRKAVVKSKPARKTSTATDVIQPSNSRKSSNVRSEGERRKTSIAQEADPWSINVNKIAPYPRKPVAKPKAARKAKGDDRPLARLSKRRVYNQSNHRQWWHDDQEGSDNVKPPYMRYSQCVCDLENDGDDGSTLSLGSKLKRAKESGKAMWVLEHDGEEVHSVPHLPDCLDFKVDSPVEYNSATIVTDVLRTIDAHPRKPALNHYWNVKMAHKLQRITTNKVS